MECPLSLKTLEEINLLTFEHGKAEEKRRA
jgi:hypothetical protein